MALWVQKYGGTSVGSPERIRSVADRIVQARNEGHALVVVVSAMGRTTDELIDLAHQVAKQPPDREMDMLLTVGERVSMALLSMALAERGVAAISLTGSQSGIITTDGHRRARIVRILGDRIRRGLDEGRVVIVAGFQGVSESKEITTLGRGGSDTTAVSLAATLKAEKCVIYTDVDGVFTADPRVVPEARFVPRIAHDLMVELAHRGAGVLHPRSVELAKRYRVPLEVAHSLNRKEGTIVEASPMEAGRIVGVTADEDRPLVTLTLARPTLIESIWSQAASAHLSLLAPIVMDRSMMFFIESESQGEWKKILDRMLTDGFLESVSIDPDWVPVSLVGERVSQEGELLEQVYSTLKSAHVEVRMAAASPLALTLGVRKNRCEDAIRALHGRFLS